MIIEIVRKVQAQKHKNGDSCIANEYPMDNKDIGGAVVKVSGRYPDKERVVNENCYELVFIMDGSGKIVVEGEEVKLKVGDIVLVEPEERYFWDGNLVLFVASHPSWYPNQHKKVK